MFKIDESLIGAGVRASKRRYKRLCALTVQACGIEEIPLSLAYSYAWGKLYALWDLFEAELGVQNIMEACIQAVHWGVFDYHRDSDELQEIISIMYEELCTHGTGYKVWMEQEGSNWDAEVIGVINEGDPWGFFRQCHSYAHFHYQKFRTLLKLSDKITLDSSKMFRSYMRTYKKSVYLLLPEAKQWDDEQWLDDENITRALHKKYGVDYAQSWNDYDALISLIQENTPGEKSEAFYQCVYSISNMPLSIAQVIWPKNTVRKLTTLFVDVQNIVNGYESSQTAASPQKQRPNYVHSFEMKFMKDCWLYKQIDEWTKDGTIDLNKNYVVKKALFNIEMKS